MDTQNSSNKPIDWQYSALWVLLAIGCFHVAYSSLRHPVAGLLIFGYALGLVKLSDQRTVRRAFYFGLTTGFFCYAPQLVFFWNIFGPAAVVLWLVLAFWIGLFTALVCGCNRRWGKGKTTWLIPVIWTGIEYFRSELYYLKFAWLNIGYVFGNFHPALTSSFGVYGTGFLMFSIIAMSGYRFQNKRLAVEWIFILAFCLVVAGGVIGLLKSARYETPASPLSIVGVQAEFPPMGVIPKLLDQALIKNTNAPLFVMSEYSLDGPVPNSIKNWCRKNSRFLIIGGKDPMGTTNFYNTAFVVGTNGEIVFKQAKCVPIQFFRDGLPATQQKVWNSPWGKIGICICYDLSYTRVTDELVRQGAQLLIVPTMDVDSWGRHEHELHSRVAPVRAAEYGIPIFRVASSGISQAVTGYGQVVAHTSMPGNGEIFTAQLRLPMGGSLPIDRYLAPICTAITTVVFGALVILAWRDKRTLQKK